MQDLPLICVVPLFLTTKWQPLVFKRFHTADCSSDPTLGMNFLGNSSPITVLQDLDTQCDTKDKNMTEPYQTLSK